MIELLTGLPDGVIGFEGNGKIHADDYNRHFPLAERDAAIAWAAAD